MIEKLIIGIFGISILMTGWAWIQKLWGRSFSDQLTDSDVLAGRSDCGNCGCAGSCANKFSDSKNK